MRMRMTIECRECGGAGEVYERGDRGGPDCGEIIRCPECGGSGEYDEDAIAVPQGPHRTCVDDWSEVDL